MSARLLQEVGEALYGERWQTDLSRAINVADRTVRRWVAGDGEPGPGVYDDLLKLALERQPRLAKVIEKLQKKAAG